MFDIFQMVSTKFYCDYDEMEVFASVWAEEGGVDVERLKQLEITFLNAIQWNILVSQNEFNEKLRTVEQLLALKEGLRRNFFTYTEMELLMPSLEIAKRILNYTTILMFSYACSIATIALSSVILASVPVTTNLAEMNNSNATEITLPAAMIPLCPTNLDTPAIDSDINSNFTFNFPLFDRVTNWNNRKRNFGSFPLIRKMDPAPLHW